MSNKKRKKVIKLVRKSNILTKERLLLIAKHEFNKNIDKLNKKELVTLISMLDKAIERNEEVEDEIPN